jgi:hypothetical protein
MDYKDEQNNEIEALDSIYSGEMESKRFKSFSSEPVSNRKKLVCCMCLNFSSRQYTASQVYNSHKIRSI